MLQNAYGNITRINLLIKEFVTGHQKTLNKEEQAYIDEVRERIDMDSGWTFLKRSRQLCNDMILSASFRDMLLTWKEMPWMQNPDWENQGWHIGPMYYPTDYGACCHLAPHLDLKPNNENKSLVQLYKELDADALNGVDNGLELMLDAEQFNYADYKKEGAGFLIGLHHHQDRPMIQFSSHLIHSVMLNECGYLSLYDVK